MNMAAVAINPIPTATMPYWAKQQRPAIPLPQQLYPQQHHQPQPQPTIQTTNPDTIPEKDPMITNLPPNLTTTMMKISKTTLEKERKSSNSRETQLLEIATTQTQTTHQETTRQQEKQTLPAMPFPITPTITVAMRDMISSNMMPMPMTPQTTIKANMQVNQVNMEKQVKDTIPVLMTTTPQIMMPLHINTTIQQEVKQQQIPLQRHPRRQQQQLLVQQQQQRQRQQPLVSPHQPKAELNRERAVALWGQQVQLGEETSATNPICHNSLPRQQPKSSCDPQLDLTANLSNDCIDPFDLEFSVSSPSLMRSYGSDSSSVTEIPENEAYDYDNNTEDDDDDASITDKTLSPAQTAIRREMP
ncbi:hypothetical protein DOY81_001642 [Sarcophaga bullata]|nr:hypothetical protein DOY81_001642 [Sarcophaga bullata]